MKIRLVALGASLLLAALGCRTDPNMVLLERELRLQEDEIFRLRHCVEECQAALAATRRESATLRRDSVGSTVPGVDLSLDGAPSGNIPESGEAPDFVAPAPARPVPPPVELEEPGPLESVPARTGPGAARGLDGWPTDRTEMEEAPRWSPPPGAARPGTSSGSMPQPLDEGATHASAESTQVARVLISRSLSGGFDADGRPGDEGVIVVLEPRDPQDRYVAAPANVSVVLLDPALDTRVARWDFSAAETARMFYDSTFGRGLQLEMTWPDDPPENRELHVFVRYATADGRQLDVDQPIRVEPPGRSLAGWSAREPRSGNGGTSHAGAPAPSSRHAPTPASPTTGPRHDDAPSPSRTATRPAWSPDRP
jgi:hypothetical protein